MQRSTVARAAALAAVLLRGGAASAASSLRSHGREGPVGAGVADGGPVQPAPEPMYNKADDVARFLEKRRPIELVPEGANEFDLSEEEQKELASIFEDGEKPDIFQNCLLIHDFATPLRVGSALSVSRQSKALRVSPSPAAAPPPSGLSPAVDDDDDDDSPVNQTAAPPPDTVLVAKGGVVQRDEAPDGKADSIFMKVDMVAYMESVAGEVSVVARGAIAKWTSKKVVPLAGYLCTSEAGAVLYTLPTPCVATTIEDDGVPAGPPAKGSKGEKSFAVFVGNEKLHFSSKKKARHFCHHLARKIAEDPGDNEWDTEKLKGLSAEEKRDMKLSTFVQLSRKDPPEAWTTGTKKVLVIVMDWMEGDQSKAPLSKQTMGPDHYQNKIFPRVAEAFRQMSWGKFQISFDVVPEVIRFTRPRSRYAADGWPFPGLYNGAVQSLAGHSTYGSQYDASAYDLVYTISPAQAPTGTKGVAWVGAKGAMCNGCEAISENFQVMVAVHELGHNLGLSHASSTALEYGNPFDWMGNYPDVQGLSYGMGYKLKLHWLPRSSVAKIEDGNLEGLNDRFIVTPFDAANGPAGGQVFGIQLSLHRNPRDIFFSYRKMAGRDAGVYAVFQDKDSPNSELIDMACHSPSQKDARMQPGWTFLDPTSQVVVVVESVTDESAVLHVYRAPGATELAAIRARSTFSDGMYKCPRTCTDSDLLVSSFEGCAALAGKGYCDSGSITMGGKKLSVKEDLCPQSCNRCDSVLAGSPVVGEGGGATGCDDRNVKISGMSCPVIAAKGHCDANTNIGHVGKDLCPKSCGNCPPRPSFSGGSDSTFGDPAPGRTHGGGAAISLPPPEKLQEQEEPEEQDEPEEKRPVCEDDDDWKDKDGHDCAAYGDYISKGLMTRAEACAYDGGKAGRHCKETCKACPEPAEEALEGEHPACEDDPVWKDKDGDGCSAYSDYIRKGYMTRTSACEYDGGDAGRHCRETCQTCVAPPRAIRAAETTPSCADKQCVGSWLKSTGQCFECKQWSSRCDEEEVKKDCPLTCGTCELTPAELKEDEEETEELAKDVPCVDSECIDTWQKATGKCFKCEDFAEDYCGNDADFMRSCPKSCKLCSGKGAACLDDYKTSVCLEYKSWGWCSKHDVGQHCLATCELCENGLRPAHDVHPIHDVPPATAPPPHSAAAGRPLPLGAALLAAGVAILSSWR